MKEQVLGSWSSDCSLLSPELIVSFSQCLLSTYYVPGTDADSGNTSMNKMDKVAVLMELPF